MENCTNMWIYSNIRLDFTLLHTHKRISDYIHTEKLIRKNVRINICDRYIWIFKYIFVTLCPRLILATQLGKSSKKIGYLTVRLTVRVDPPPYGQLFCVFFWGVHLTSVFDYTWFKTNFDKQNVFWPFVWPFGCVKMSISNRSKHYNGTKNAMKGSALDMHF